MEFYNNKENDVLKFKINSEGIDTNKIEPRLILTTNENKNYFFVGNIENNICKFTLPQLSLYEKGDNGKIKFEIISNEMYFPVWQDNFEIKTKVNVTLEKMIFDIQQETKQQIKISATPEIIKEDETPKIDEQIKMMKNDKKILIESYVEKNDNLDNNSKDKTDTINNKLEKNDNDDIDDNMIIKRFESF